MDGDWGMARIVRYIRRSVGVRSVIPDVTWMLFARLSISGLARTNYAARIAASTWSLSNERYRIVEPTLACLIATPVAMRSFPSAR